MIGLPLNALPQLRRSRGAGFVSENHLAEILVNQIRSASADLQAAREVIRAAVKLLAEKDHQIDSVRARNLHLLDQIRALRKEVVETPHDHRP